MKRLIALILTLVMVVSMAACGPTAQTDETTKAQETTQAPETTAAPAAKFTAGTYSSVQMGHNGDVTVEVTFSDDAITDVQMTNHNETDRISDAAITAVRETVVNLQTLDVDVVSGSTLTYAAIMRGIFDCVSQAGGEDSDFGDNTTPKQEDATIDATVVIVGAGGAGLSAAVEAAQQGLTNIVVVEKLASVGGSTGHSSGALVCPTPDDDPSFDTEVFYDMHINVAKAVPDLARSVADIALENISWLRGMGVTLNDYRATSSGYEVRYVTPNTDKSFVRPNGMKIINGLYDTAMATGVVDIQLNTAATSIIMKDGVAAGVIAERKDGSILTVNADAVILATGGYDNGDIALQFDPYVHLMNHVSGCGNVGDGILMGMAVGADTFYSENGPKTGGNSNWLNQLGLPTNFMCVNGLGKRILAEGCHYAVEKAAMQASESPYVYRLFDSTNDTTVMEELVSKGRMSKFETIEDLASGLDIDLEGLKATIDRYNSMKGKTDEDFGKDASLMLGFGEGPYYSIQVKTEILMSVGGLRINGNCEVLDVEGNAIPMLYAAGETANGVYFVEKYPFSGSAIQFSVASGRIAARSIAGKLAN